MNAKASDRGHVQATSHAPAMPSQFPSRLPTCKMACQRRPILASPTRLARSGTYRKLYVRILRMGRGFKSHKSTKRKPPAGARWHVPPVNPPVVGSRVRVYWPAEDAWFRGTAAETILQDGALIFRVAYDDGDEAWVAAFGDDKWAFADAAAAAAASDAARVAAAAAEAIAEAEGCGLCLWGSVFVSVCRACLRFAWSLRRARLASRVSTTCVSQSEVRPADQGLLHAQVVRMRVLHASVRLCLCVTAQGAQQIQAAPFGSLGAVQAPAQASHC